MNFEFEEMTIKDIHIRVTELYNEYKKKIRNFNMLVKKIADELDINTNAVLQIIQQNESKTKKLYKRFFIEE